MRSRSTAPPTSASSPSVRSGPGAHPRMTTVAGCTLADVLASATPFRLELARAFRGLDHREGVLIQGPSGWGEFAPFDDYSDERSARWLASALEASHGSWPPAVRQHVPVNAILPQADETESFRLADIAVREHGCTTVKVKVGGQRADNERSIAAVRRALDAALGAGIGRIRLDANAGWSVDEALHQLSVLEQYGIEYVEQPCAEVSDLLALRRRTRVPIAVDESIRLAGDPGSVRVREFADIAVLKPTTLGGVRRTLDLAQLLDLPVVISGSLDSSVGLSVGVATAAALPDLDLACGLGTGTLLATDLVARPVVPEAGRLACARTAPDQERLALASVQISAERAAWWRDRLAAAWTHLP